MSRKWWSVPGVLIACLTLLFTVMAPSVESQEPDIDEVTITDIAAEARPGEHPLITAYVSVLDEQGQQVPGLGPEDFTVEEFTNPIDEISASSERQGVAVDLLVDVSGSMECPGMSPDGRLQDVKDAQRQFLESLGEKDWASVFTFSKVVEQVQPLKPAREVMGREIPIEIPSDPELQFTCLFDAMWDAIEDLTSDEEKRGPEFARMKKAIFIFSDGADSGLSVCRHDLTDVKKLLIARDPKGKISVYAVGVGSEQAGGGCSVNFGDLKNLADITEGEFIHYFGETEEEEVARGELNAAFESFLTQGEQYVIRYDTEACADLVKLRVEVGGLADETEVKIPPVDPKIDLTGLDDDQTVSGIVELKPEFVLEQCPIREASYYVNGVKEATVASPFTWRWDTAKLPDNPNAGPVGEDSEGNGVIENVVVKVEACDQKDRCAADEVSGIEVKIPHPEVEIVDPATGELFEREARWRAECEETAPTELPVKIEVTQPSQHWEIRQVEYYLDGQSVASLQTVPDQYLLDISTLGCTNIDAETQHTLKVRVEDELGLSSEAETPLAVRVHIETFGQAVGRFFRNQVRLIPAWLALILVIALGVYVLVVGPQQAVEELKRGVERATQILGVVPRGTRLVLMEDGKDVRPYAVQQTTNLGRDETRADIAFDNPSVSRLHATLRREEEGFVIYDRGSKNGTWVNERRLPFRGQTILEDGDIIELARGGVRLRFEREDQD